VPSTSEALESTAAWAVVALVDADQPAMATPPAEAMASFNIVRLDVAESRCYQSGGGSCFENR